MSANVNENQPPEAKSNEKELNFRKQEEMFKKQLEQERVARQAAEEKAARYEAERTKKPHDDDEDYASDEPYVDRRILDKKLSKFEKSFEEKIDKRAEEKARNILEQRDRDDYLNQNGDFNETMSTENLQKFVERHPSLAKSLMRMPDGFEKQKLVYENIKALKVGQKEESKPSVQDKIDQNRRSPYYQPTGMAGPGYANQGDFSPAGKKSSYDKMQELKARLRI